MRRRLALLLVAATACSVKVDVGAKDKPQGHRLDSSTPHVTTRDGTAGEDLLLTTTDLRAVDGLPGDLVVQSVDKTELYENPDPRGVCGGKVQAPSLDGAMKGIGSAAAFGRAGAVPGSGRFGWTGHPNRPQPAALAECAVSGAGFGLAPA